MEFAVDRDLPVPLRTQLQGLIEYGIACGELVQHLEPRGDACVPVVRRRRLTATSGGVRRLRQQQRVPGNADGRRMESDYAAGPQRALR